MEKPNEDILGIPKPYSSTDLPTPRNVMSKIVYPLKIWQFLLFIVLSVYLISFTLNQFYGMKYNNVLLLSAVPSFLISSLVTYRSAMGTGREKMSSIENVSKTPRYTVIASRIFILSLIAVTVSFIVMAGVHLIDSVSIDPITRFSAVLSLGLGLTFSYTIIHALCSYTPLYQKGLATLPVEISSLPKIVTFFGFVIPPILIGFAGFMYDKPPFIQLPFNLTVIDSLILIVSLTVIYLAMVSRL